jgi:hypothetical protein
MPFIMALLQRWAAFHCIKRDTDAHDMAILRIFSIKAV